MSNRGIISFKLGGTEFDLVPSLENLDNLETATNKPIYMVASNPKLSDSIKVILSCAKSVDNYIGPFCSHSCANSIEGSERDNYKNILPQKEFYNLSGTIKQSKEIC